jgi:galactose mutarotase-like enzyme
MAHPRIVLETPDGSARAEVAPSMGALVTKLVVQGRDVLFADEASLTSDDPKAARRGGVPVLFPSPGRLKSDLFEAEGRYGSLPNHGFARDRPFAITKREGSSVSLRLDADDETLSRYPWQFALEIDLTLEARALHYDVRITNEDDETMPCGFGLHPYFLVRDKSRARVATGATRAWDNRTKRHVDLALPIDFTTGEIDLHLVDHWTRQLDLDTGDGPVRVTASDAFRTWVLWTLEGRDFVCVEPWTSPADALNSKKDLVVLAPGERRDLRVSIEVPEADRP